MKRFFLFRVGGKDLHLPKTIGAFIVFAGILLFFQSAALMFDSWENIKYVNGCMQSASSIVELGECQQAANEAFSFHVRAEQTHLTNKQFAVALIGPVARMFLWIALMAFGVMVYNTGRLTIPVEESVREIKEKRKRKGK